MVSNVLDSDTVSVELVVLVVLAVVVVVIFVVVFVVVVVGVVTDTVLVKACVVTTSGNTISHLVYIRAVGQ